MEGRCISKPCLNNDSQLLVGRVLNYIYIGMELSSVPVYQAEVFPTPIRGFMVGSYQVSLGVGGLIINAICKGTSRIPNNSAWMIPYGLYFIIPTFVASCVWFIPEVRIAYARFRIASRRCADVGKVAEMAPHERPR